MDLTKEGVTHLKREGLTFTVSVYSDLEGDPPYRLNIEVLENGIEIECYDDRLRELWDAKDWTAYVEYLMEWKAHQKRGTTMGAP